jgi:hypothetical protein
LYLFFFSSSFTVPYTAVMERDLLAPPFPFCIFPSSIPTVLFTQMLIMTDHQMKTLATNKSLWVGREDCITQRET